MMMMMEEEGKTKRKKQKQKEAQIESDEEEEEGGEEEETIEQKLERINAKKQRQNQRPKDDLTQENSLFPPNGSDDDDGNGGDDDSKHCGTVDFLSQLQQSQQSMLSQQSMQMTQNSISTQEDSFGNHGAPHIAQQQAGNPLTMMMNFPSLPMVGEPNITHTMQPPKNVNVKLKSGEKKTVSAVSKAQLLKLDKEELARLEPIVLNFNYNHKDRLICQGECGSAGEGGQKQGDTLVAKHITVGSEAQGNHQKIDIDHFNYKVVRKIATNFGCKNVSAASKFECRRKMAVRLTSGTVHNLDDIANPVTESKEKRINTHVRVINACFHPSLVDRFIHLNDGKSRRDYESVEGGGNPIKAFWVEVSETVNDTQNSDLCVVQHSSGEEADQRLRNLVAQGSLALADFNQTTHNSCNQMMKDITRAHENIQRAMGASGEHCNDRWEHLRRKHLEIQAGFMVPGTPVYYYALLSSTHPGIGGSWNYALDESLQSDSTTTPGDTADCKSASSITTTTRGKGDDLLLEAIQKTSNLLNQREGKAQDELLTAQCKLTEDNLSREQWKEYDAWGERVMKLRAQEGSDRLLRNVAIRVRALEETLGIPVDCSIVNDCI